MEIFLVVLLSVLLYALLGILVGKFLVRGVSKSEFDAWGTTHNAVIVMAALTWPFLVVLQTYRTILSLFKS